MSLLSRMRKPQEAPPAPVTGMSVTDLAIFQRVLYEQSGIVLKDNKRALVESRVNQRLRALGLAGYPEYLELLRADRSGEELVHLIDVISTNVTQFFREPDHFTKLAEVVDGWGEQGLKRLRFWSAACSTGEEPYSLAMTAIEAMGASPPFRLLATDIDTRVLAVARRGVYEAGARGLDAQRLKLHFQRGTGPNVGSIRVRPELARLIEFRPFNLINGDWRSLGEPFDIIFCRNVMIYFDAPTQRRVLQRMHGVLAPGGMLYVGHSENFTDARDLFRLRSKTIYERV